MEANITSDQSWVATPAKDHTCNRNDNCYAERWFKRSSQSLSPVKLFYSPFHTFIHKVLVTIHEAGLWDEVTFVPTYPR